MKMKFENVIPYLLIIISEIFSLSLFKPVFADESGFIGQICRQTSFTLECNYIPQEIPQNITVVRIKYWFGISDSKGFFPKRICNEHTFQSKTWQNVMILEIDDLSNDNSDTDGFQLQSKCFYPLGNLDELHLHSNNLVLSENALVGLKQLRLLDFRGCSRLEMIQMNKALRGSNKAPNLSELSLSHAGYNTKLLQLDEAFVDALAEKPLKKLDVSDTQIGVLNVTEIVKNMKQLEMFNVSNTKIGYAYYENLEHLEVLTKLKTIDVSYATLPSNLFVLFPGLLKFSNAEYNYNMFKEVNFINLIISTTSVNFTKTIPDETTICFDNVTIYVDSPLNSKVEEIHFNKNNLDRLDFQFVFGNNSMQTLKKLELYDNEMTFINPSVLTIAPNLQILDLSDNFLNAMSNENLPLFETLLRSLAQLKIFYLSNNGLHDIPRRFFESNVYLEVIDLSNNWLEQVNFDLKNLKYLKELNLCNNNIVRLGQVSINNLNTLQFFANASHRATLDITFHLNPIACAACDDTSSIKWLLRAIQQNATNLEFECETENGEQEEIDEATLEKLQRECRRKVHIQASAISAGCVFVVIIIILIFIYKRIKIIQKSKNRAAIRNRFRDGYGSYEFVAFLGYSSGDENFVNTYVINQMNETLQQMIGANRNLICTGDHYFRPGRMVHDEIAVCLERASVMVVLLSDIYCSSVYCQSEFDQAHLYQKPIVLMLHGNVSEENMSPTMRELYRRNARILWSEENGTYVLKSTWENVCSSILDLVK